MSDFGIKIITGNEEFHTRELGLKMIDFKIPQPDAKPTMSRFREHQEIWIYQRFMEVLDMKIEADCRLLLLYVTIL